MLVASRAKHCLLQVLSPWPSSGLRAVLLSSFAGLSLGKQQREPSNLLCAYFRVTGFCRAGMSTSCYIQTSEIDGLSSFIPDLILYLSCSSSRFPWRLIIANLLIRFLH